MAESVRTFDRLYYSADDSTYVQHEFLDGSSLGLNEEFLDTNGIRGALDHTAERVRRNTRQSAGQIVQAPTPVELSFLLPWITGGTFSTGVITPGTSLPARYVRTARDGTHHLYDGCKVQRAVFSAAERGPLQVAMDLVGVDEAASSAPSGPPTVDITGGPFVMTDAALTIGGTNYGFRQFQLTLDHPMDVRFNGGSGTPSSITAVDRNVEVSLALPYGDASAVYGSALSGVAVVVTFTNGTVSFSATLPAVQAPRQPVPLGGRGTRDLPWVGVARKAGSNPTVSFFLDSTP